MKLSLPLTLLLVCATTACSVEQDGTGTVKQEFHNPFVADNWAVKNEKPVAKNCVLTSGNQAIDVVLHKEKGKKISGSVISQRRLDPGNELKANIGKHYYQTSEAAFSAEDSAKLIEDLKTGDKAYFTWSNIQTDDGITRRSSIIEPTNFNQSYAQCRKELLK